MPPTVPMIELETVTKSFGSPARGERAMTHALRDVSLSIPRGGVWAIVGPNGAGKSTLLGLLLGFLFPSKGRVRVNGEAPRRYLRRHGAAYLPERFSLPGEWTPRAALEAFARLEGWDAAEASRRVDDALARFGLETQADRRTHALSRGTVQRLGLAQTVLAERELVVLDEPTEGLDPLWRIRLREHIEALRAEGRTVLVASHDLAELQRLADRAVVLEEGRVRDVLTVSRSSEERHRYHLRLGAPVAQLERIFPGAERLGDGEEDAWAVSVADEAELNARLAALLAAGGQLRELRPVQEALEDRVRRALAGGEG